MNVAITWINSMKANKKLFEDKNVLAWILMLSAISVHVIDESVTNFLPFYNQYIRGIAEHFGSFDLPTFSFKFWLGGLVLAIIAGFALTPVIRRGGKIIRIVSTSLGVLMILNACGHISGSLYLGRTLPGFWSSPLLLCAAIYLVIRGFNGRGWRQNARLRSKPSRSIP